MQSNHVKLPNIIYDYWTICSQRGKRKVVLFTGLFSYWLKSTRIQFLPGLFYIEQISVRVMKKCWVNLYRKLNVSQKNNNYDSDK